MATNTTKPDDAHQLLRYIPWAKLRRDADDNVVGILAVAFEMRENENYLSATWIEHFGQQPPANLHSAVNAIKKTMKVGKKSGFSTGVVSEIKGACSNCGCHIRIVRESQNGNPGHTAVRRWPRDNQDLFDAMANESWATLHLNKTFP